ncbi:MAG: hypothetical protein A3B73_00940 [Omnitrophica WOR_2 bacterium RIFCSPHIGHO2_02_FULL_63_39]|nr:MAG: hypothetical protein A2Z92_03240 [Omnitrophica WOR_2 bacterium GWA2_63_20]OGX17966.1 MAG: hypothetical protein A2105_04045 [Omnitrophica WOR_2 bacterium GWF2_63_9]OGX31452.1 MAG: hypothetical protein A3E56_00015 [Omnitrophica WOR_2 bacterium RIFCSPHIGHO2_12_FULL_64_13]OGX36372.1 MAG: hypothetical protein A3B73_00940 [Omnitrophica WOR_2 bacterium RIFCSPHIGHO2_02_FULL_63_39]OGX50128.1 MAG: hypothetical protein A3G88_02520 [Omnitrophica WOR_2 bacterium RIFCSPLOWO2_12_FULL_63_16]HAM40707.1
MTDNNTQRAAVSVSLGLAGLLGILALPAPLFAQEEAEKQEVRERAELPPLTAQIPPEEALAAIKRRAKKILEARRAARRMKFSGELSEAFAYETNPATASSHKGNVSAETSAYLSWSKKLTPTLTWLGTYYGSYLLYEEYHAGDYTDHTLTPLKLQWQPGRMWRVESWLDLERNHYWPDAADSSYKQIKWTGRVRQNLFKSWYHQVQYEWFGRDYVHKKARDGGGADTATYRKDARYRARYKVGTTVKKALLSVENDFYNNDSNDNRNNYYDYHVWKITSSLSGSATKKLYLSGSFAFERKNYDVRPVSGITSEARYDDKYTMSTSASYDLNDTWRLAAGLTFDHLGSNEPTGEYDNMKESFTVTAKF